MLTRRMRASLERIKRCLKAYPKRVSVLAPSPTTAARPANDKTLRSCLKRR